MMPLLVFRERVKKFYQRYDDFLIPIIKFIFAFITFQVINGQIGYDERLKSIPVVIILSLLSAFTPSSIMVLLAAAVTTFQVYFVSDILSIIIILILLIIYLLFARFTPSLGYALLAIPVLYILKIPFIIPILLGLISTPIAIIPVGCGVVIYYLIQIIKSAAVMQVNLTVEDTMTLYTYVIDSLIKNKQMIMAIVIFSLIILVTYLVRKMKADYAFEIAIAAGALTCILGFLVSYFILNNSGQILSMIFGTIVSGAIVYIIHFFRLTLDYSGVEHTQFEDDVYYYYVKAVPKVTVTTPQMNIKHINDSNGDREHYHRRDIRSYMGDSEDELEDEEDEFLDNDYEEETRVDRNNQGE